MATGRTPVAVMLSCLRVVPLENRDAEYNSMSRAILAMNVHRINFEQEEDKEKPETIDYLGIHRCINEKRMMPVLLLMNPVGCHRSTFHQRLYHSRHRQVKTSHLTHLLSKNLSNVISIIDSSPLSSQALLQWRGVSQFRISVKQSTKS